MSKKLLEDAQRRIDGGEDPLRPWTASGVRIGNVDLGDIQVNGTQDTEDFLRYTRALIEAHAQAMPAPVVAPETPAESSPLLSEAIESHLGDMTRRKLVDDTISESRYTLRLFLATTTTDIRAAFAP